MHRYFSRGHHAHEPFSHEHPHALFFMRHHRSRFGGGHFAGFMGGDFGGRGFGAGRKLSSDELQVLLLALLAARPSHGYELIKLIDERSGGFYTPSPGVIYPALTYLEEVGHASVEASGARKLYSITTQGQKYLQEHQELADSILGQLDRIAKKMGRVRDAFSGEDQTEEQAAPREAWLARHELRAALAEKRHADPKEARRIAAILKRAAAEIRGE